MHNEPPASTKTFSLQNTTMSSTSPQKRNNPFSRMGTLSPEPGLLSGRPKSAMFSSPLSSTQSPAAHNRHQSYSSIGGIISPSNEITRNRTNSKTGTPSSTTFAPSFINSEEMRRGPEIKGIEGENDFSGKRYVWLKDPKNAFVKGWIVEDLENNQILVQCDDGSAC